jgi:drug/metabolite transporter (DMT)-like permease
MLTGVYTTLALVAFAANSLLCRIALHDGAVDAATFSTIRFTSGAVTLLLITIWSGRPAFPVAGSWTSAALLAAYAVPFSFAYTGLSTGTGALIMFGTVQVTMLAAALGSGERPHAAQWIGLSLALTGLVVLVFPGLASPPLAAAALMTVAGVTWGLYSVRGRGETNPLADTTGNFVRSVPLIAAVSLATLPRVHIEARGLALAVASGAVASGLGYVIWYAALRGLTGMQSAVVQLSVPILAALGGVIFLTETISIRLVVSGVLVLGGIALALTLRAGLYGRSRVST